MPRQRGATPASPSRSGTARMPHSLLRRTPICFCGPARCPSKPCGPGQRLCRTSAKACRRTRCGWRPRHLRRASRAQPATAEMTEDANAAAAVSIAAAAAAAADSATGAPAMRRRLAAVTRAVAEAAAAAAAAAAVDVTTVAGSKTGVAARLRRRCGSGIVATAARWHRTHQVYRSRCPRQRCHSRCRSLCWFQFCLRLWRCLFCRPQRRPRQRRL